MRNRLMLLAFIACYAISGAGLIFGNWLSKSGVDGGRFFGSIWCILWIVIAVAVTRK